MGRIKDRQDKPRGQIKVRTEQAPREDFELRPPIFSFEFLQSGWCIQDCGRDERAKMLDRLRILGKLTWKQIRQEGKHQYGTEIIHQDSIKAPIPPFVTPDTNLIAFRAYEKVAMVGYKTDRTFHVLWIDRAWKLYSHG